LRGENPAGIPFPGNISAASEVKPGSFQESLFPGIRLLARNPVLANNVRTTDCCRQKIKRVIFDFICVWFKLVKILMYLVKNEGRNANIL